MINLQFMMDDNYSSITNQNIFIQTQDQKSGQNIYRYNSKALQNFMDLIKSVVNALNILEAYKLDTPRALYHSTEIKWYDNNIEKTLSSLDDLFMVMIPPLTTLNVAVGASRDINQEVINALKKLEERSKTESISTIQIMQILSHFSVPGIKYIDYKSDQNSNDEKISAMFYPTHLLMDRHLCKINGTIMLDAGYCDPDATDPVFIDYSARIKAPINPFNRQSWSPEFKRNKVLQDEIELFIKKIEFVYYHFYQNQQFRLVYEDTNVQEWLQNNTLNYEDFCTQINNDHERLTEIAYANAHFTLPNQNPKSILPLRYIGDLFSLYQVHTLTPTAKEYEQLIRRMAALGNYDHFLMLLEKSAILDVIRIDIKASNTKGQTAIDLLEKFQPNNPNRVAIKMLIEDYAARHQPTSKSGCVIS